ALSGEYKPRLKAGPSVYRVLFTSPGKDTLVLASSGDLKKGKEILLSLAPKAEQNRIAVSTTKPNRTRSRVDNVPKEVQRPPAPVTRVEDTTDIAINGKKYRLVKARALTGTNSGLDETVEEIRILNSEDSVCHEESWKVRPGPDGFESTRLASFVRLVGSKADGLMVFYDDAPAAPPGETAFRIFWDRESCLAPLTEEISIYGQIPGWNRKDSVLKLENGVLAVEVSAWYFEVTVPFNVVLEAAGAEIDLSPELPFKPTKRVKVPPFGKAEILSVYLPIPENALESPVEILQFVAANPAQMSIQIRMDGITGWIRVHDIQKFGFPARG
ncbi:MAG TPA: hypothetical protein VK465_03595, partial [Fibrobacteria bacterium]|nr:hypothetical protein [Fibrobacteria bacterium]